jgi:hypothetical protein
MSCWDNVLNAMLVEIAEEHGLSIGRVKLIGEKKK